MLESCFFREDRRELEDCSDPSDCAHVQYIHPSAFAVRRELLVALCRVYKTAFQLGACGFQGAGVAPELASVSGSSRSAFCGHIGVMLCLTSVLEGGLVRTHVLCDVVCATLVFLHHARFHGEPSLRHVRVVWAVIGGRAGGSLD